MFSWKKTFSSKNILICFLQLFLKLPSILLLSALTIVQILYKKVSNNDIRNIRRKKENLIKSGSLYVANFSLMKTKPDILQNALPSPLMLATSTSFLPLALYFLGFHSWKDIRKYSISKSLQRNIILNYY